MTGLFGMRPDRAAQRSDHRRRAEALKARIGVADVADRAGGLRSDGRGGRAVICPACRSTEVVIVEGGRGFACRACRATGDILTYQQLAFDQRFGAALDTLEAAFPEQPAAGMERLL